jgi:mannosyltransferase
VHAGTRNGQPDYRALAAILTETGRPGDAMVLPSQSGHRFRVGLTVYTPPDRMPRDVLATRSAADAGRLDATECPAASCLGHPTRLWVGCWGRCGDPLAGLPGATAARIRAGGYRPARIWQVTGGGIALFTPTPEKWTGPGPHR